MLKTKALLFKIFLIGLAAGVLLTAQQKTLEILMLANLYSVLALAFSLFAFSFGIWRKGDGRQGQLFKSTLMIVFAAGVVAASLVNRNFTTLALGGLLYYPVPLPKSGWINIFSLVYFSLVGPASFFPLGQVFSSVFQSPEERVGRALFPFFSGFALGIGVVYLLGRTGPYIWLGVGYGLWAFALFGTFRTVLATALIASVLIGFDVNPKRSFFTWGITDYKYLGGGYGHDVKVDFISFTNDQCIGLVFDNVMMTFECRQARAFSSEFDYLLRTLLDPYDPPATLFNGEKFVEKETKPQNRGLDVIDIGRSAGGNSRVLDFYSGPNHNSTIEFEPAISSRLLQSYTEYTGGIYLKPNASVYTGDYRTNLEQLAEQGKKFDYVFFSGIGTKTYMLPRNYLYAEHFLLTSEGTDLVFDRLLKSDGVLFIDWGVSSTNEIQWFLAGLPREASVTAYWATLSEFPLSGCALMLVFASKDHEKIKAINDQLNRFSGFIPVDIHPGYWGFRTSDNRPLLQIPLHVVIAIFHVFLTGIVIAVFRKIRKKVIAADPENAAVHFPFILAGLAAGFGETLFASFNPFVFGPFGLPSWNTLHFCFLAGIAVGCAFGLIARQRVDFLHMVAPVFVIGGISLLFLLKGQKPVFTGAALGGLGVGFMLLALFENITANRAKFAFMYYFFATAASLVVLPILFFIGGYYLLAATTVLLCLAGTAVQIQPRRKLVSP